MKILLLNIFGTLLVVVAPEPGSLSHRLFLPCAAGRHEEI
jgi:hypothetical protein